MERESGQGKLQHLVSDCLTGPRLPKEISSVFKVEKYIMFSFETGTEIKQDV